MVSKETLTERARIAVAFSSLIHGPGGSAYQFDGGRLNPSGEIAVIPAAANESIAVAFHRIQQTGEKHVVLATLFDDYGQFIEMLCGKTTANDAPIDLPGRVTVREWFEKYGDDFQNESFSCSGNEFALEISGIRVPTALKA